MKTIAIAVHPDDETLGAGGSLLKYKQQGAEIFWIIVTKTHIESQIDTQQETIAEVSKLYGFSDVFHLQKTATTLSTKDLPEIISELDKIISNVKPDTVIVPCLWDVHSDHRIVAQACMPLLKPHRYGFIHRILAMEVLSETDIGSLSAGGGLRFSYFEDITEFFEKKASILSQYKTEVAEFPFPRSIGAIESLARLRGTSIGSQYAEAFIPLKIVN